MLNAAPSKDKNKKPGAGPRATPPAGPRDDGIAPFGPLVD
jgi:hypothetical protein